MGTPENYLELKAVSKSYGRCKALIQVHITMGPGIYGLLGPNGAGKSTLMNIIVGNLLPDEGSVTYGGKNILGGTKAFRSILGFMPQQQTLYPQFTGRHFLYYIAALKGVKKKETADRVRLCASLVNMEEHLDKRVGGYSGGMKQRLFIAQAILNDPEVLVLDEPTAGLDPKERIRIRNLVSEIARNKIVLLATHVVSDVEPIAKEMILMKKGRVLEKASMSQLTRKLFPNEKRKTLEDVYMYYFGDEENDERNRK